MKTRRAETIEACAEAARQSGMAIIAHMPRMAEFYRKRANEQLRAARAAGDQTSVNDAKAKLEMLRWVDGWCRGPVDTWRYRENERERRVSDDMNSQMSMIGYALRYLVRAHADHPDFRQEWAA